MLDSIRAKLHKRYFDMRVRGIFETPPAPCNPEADFVVLSQLHAPHLTMYMVALKSFARFVIPREYVLVDDGLSAADRALISRNVDRVRFLSVSEVERGSCPSGGCWERLCAISSLNEYDYVIQLDSDTLTLCRPDEVLDCLATNRSFTLGTYRGRELVSLESASEYASSLDSQHVQVLGEAAFARYPDKEAHRYVRGCAGFAGFAKTAARLEAVSDFSQTMSGLVGAKKWAEWGSEQLTSNFFIANSEEPVVLPVESYPFMSDKVEPERCKLIHFYGHARFEGGLYARLAQKLVADLNFRL
ncbi:MAG: hypothetical protein RLW61_17745 [Gammaproteobacteria bacterium]